MSNCELPARRTKAVFGSVRSSSWSKSLHARCISPMALIAEIQHFILPMSIRAQLMKCKIDIVIATMLCVRISVICYLRLARVNWLFVVRDQKSFPLMALINNSTWILPSHTYTYSWQWVKRSCSDFVADERVKSDWPGAKYVFVTDRSQVIRAVLTHSLRKNDYAGWLPVGDVSVTCGA